MFTWSKVKGNLINSHNYSHNINTYFTVCFMLLGGLAALSFVSHLFTFTSFSNLQKHIGLTLLRLLTLIHVDCPLSSLRLMRSVECRSRLFHGSSGWENQLLPHPNQVRNWITLSKRFKMISHRRTWLVDLDVFGQ